MSPLRKEIEALAAATGFSGVVRVDRAGETEALAAYGLAHRAHGVPNSVDTQFGIASGAKGFTAVTVASLIEDGLLELSTTARSILGADLPLIRDDVTVEHLLAHRSGIGDYLDEEAGADVSEYLMPVPVHELASTESYLAVLGGHDTKFLPGERFSYSNGGYVVLALIAERRSGAPFHELVQERVCEPAGMADTAFLRSDELPGTAATGYVSAERTNVFHLPVRGSGDGGIYTTVADVHRFWRAFLGGAILPSGRVAELIRPRSATPDGGRRYGLGFWLGGSGDAVRLEGSDAGVSFMSAHDPGGAFTWTVVSNTTDGAWPLARLLIERCGG